MNCTRRIATVVIGLIALSPIAALAHENDPHTMAQALVSDCHTPSAAATAKLGGQLAIDDHPEGADFAHNWFAGNIKSGFWQPFDTGMREVLTSTADKSRLLAATGHDALQTHADLPIPVQRDCHRFETLKHKLPDRSGFGCKYLQIALATDAICMNMADALPSCKYFMKSGPYIVAAQKFSHEYDFDNVQYGDWSKDGLFKVNYTGDSMDWFSQPRKIMYSDVFDRNVNVYLTKVDNNLSSVTTAMTCGIYPQNAQTMKFLVGLDSEEYWRYLKEVIGKGSRHKPGEEKVKEPKAMEHSWRSNLWIGG